MSPAHSHTHPLNGPLSGTTRVSRYHAMVKVKHIWILLKQETVSGSGISWAISKSAPRSRQITTQAPHHSVFCRPDALPAAWPSASKHSFIKYYNILHQPSRVFPVQQQAPYTCVFHQLQQAQHHCWQSTWHCTHHPSTDNQICNNSSCSSVKRITLSAGNMTQKQCKTDQQNCYRRVWCMKYWTQHRVNPSTGNDNCI